MIRWFVVHTQPRMEAVAVEHLDRQGFETYLPKFRKRRSHAGRVSEVSSPLFPRYAFVAFDPEGSGWRAIRSTRGAVDVIRVGTDPAPIDETVIADIRARQDASGHVVLARQFEPQEGDRVSIQHGAFARHTAIFKAMKDSERVVALLSLLGREFPVIVPVSHIAPAV
ncbi:transcriptional activator RfaH [Tardiphaga alba]|uniref:Transcriptional activator RfaH n=1 Tax=Tardiphaga alba TaxID=340268 RepID=A0ABX8A7Y8_9BRAD|nr:transcriptional activator RfaH [Tardiphaga alba]QUS39131.1 transcriptional activator RfaH [Tardiphaga alba]